MKDRNRSCGLATARVSSWDRRDKSQARGLSPVSESGTDSDHGSLDTNEETTVVRTRAFGHPRRNSSGVHTVSDTSDSTSDEELSSSPVSSNSGNLDCFDQKRISSSLDFWARTENKSVRTTPRVITTDPSFIIRRRPVPSHKVRDKSALNAKTSYLAKPTTYGYRGREHRQLRKDIRLRR
jgi:hypothetical protein